MATVKDKKDKKTETDTGLLFEKMIMEPDNTSFFILYMYKTGKNMLEGIKVFHRKFFNMPFVFDKIFTGMYIGFPNPVIIEIEGKSFTKFGAIFLNKEYLTAGIIAHECLHAALANEKYIVCYKGNYTGDSYLGNDPEERLTYKFQSYFEQVCDICKKAKLPLNI
jgi:hypothetical protein